MATSKNENIQKIYSRPFFCCVDIWLTSSSPPMLVNVVYGFSLIGFYYTAKPWLLADYLEFLGGIFHF